VAVALLAAPLGGCIGPDRGKDYVANYAAGEAAVGGGRFAEGASRFDDAAKGAKVRRDGEHARYLAARALASAGNHAGAALRLRAIADASPPLEDSASAAYAICEMQLASGDEAGWSGLLDVARRFPSSGVGRPALRRLIAHEDEAQGARAALDYLEHLAPTFATTDLAETMAYEIALHLAGIGEDARARDAFVTMARHWRYPHGAFWDDGLYRASVLDEKLGRYEDAAALLVEMLGERESSWLLGTYERPRYEPGMIRLCALARDRLHDRPRARACFHRVYAELTTSELRDDALWEEARLFREDGDPSSSCDRLSTLIHAFADSRYVPCAVMACPSLARPDKSGAPLQCHPYIAQMRLDVSADTGATGTPEANGAPK
jgi:hypothetical protein